MNSLKGFGVFALMAATLLAMRELAEAELVVIILTVVLIIGSTGTYVASRQRYHRDRRIVGE